MSVTVRRGNKDSLTRACVILLQDDLSDRAVTESELNKCVKENGFLGWETMSVKLNRNVSETFW